MTHPEKWRETVDPFSLSYNTFTLTEVLGYPHAGNDVFYCNGLYNGNKVTAYVKSARQAGANIKNEVETLSKLNFPNIPTVIDYGSDFSFDVTLAIDGDRLSTIVGDNYGNKSLEYMEEFGATLAQLHDISGDFPNVPDRKFFHIPTADYFKELNMTDVYTFLTKNKPKNVVKCFCHGDFHYANLLWKNHHISAILDFELSGMGNRDFDIAWSIIRRPGQKFMKTNEEISFFLTGYNSLAPFDRDNVLYYMVLIYSYFYKVGHDDSEYQAFVREWLKEAIR